MVKWEDEVKEEVQEEIEEKTTKGEGKERERKELRTRNDKEGGEAWRRQVDNYTL